MGKMNINIQDRFIETLIQEDLFVTVFTTKKGVPIRCKIKRNDKFTLQLDVNGQQQLIYKSGISTIVSSKKVLK